MAGDDDRQADLLRTFQAAISGMGPADLQQLAGGLTRAADRVTHRAARPELRRPSPQTPSMLRVRVDLDQAEPPIWRRLDLRSDLPLDIVHQVLQAAFDWTDSHLYRFAVGGEPFHPTSQVFLCPQDVEDDDVQDGVPASGVRLDEILQEPGDLLAYVYDYGDSWELTLRLEEVRPAADGGPSAFVVSGRRVAPPEDSGGGTDLASIALVVDDPTRFDRDELNQRLRAPFFVLREAGVHPRLVDLVHQVQSLPAGADLVGRVPALVTGPTHLADDEVLIALQAHVWFLDRAAHGGIDLTSAGYLTPADVEAAAQVVPAMAGWIGKNNRENHAVPLLDFRRSLQSSGLLRRYKGKLLLTRTGAAARRDPRQLWDVLARSLVPAGRGFDLDATLLLLACAGTSAEEKIPFRAIAEALTLLGWRHPDGTAIDTYDLHRSAALDALTNVSAAPTDDRARDTVGPVAATLARAALRRG